MTVDPRKLTLRPPRLRTREPGWRRAGRKYWPLGVAGTAALVELAGRVRKDDELYARYRRTFNERIEHYVSLTPAQRQHGVEELRRLLGGEPVHSVMSGILGTPIISE